MNIQPQIPFTSAYRFFIVVRLNYSSYFLAFRVSPVCLIIRPNGFYVVLSNLHILFHSRNGFGSVAPFFHCLLLQQVRNAGPSGFQFLLFVSWKWRKTRPSANPPRSTCHVETTYKLFKILQSEGFKKLSHAPRNESSNMCSETSGNFRPRSFHKNDLLLGRTETRCWQWQRA